ncbi:hypothetical protein [Tenacibaculum aestuarii]|uniref:hypothetical protein n=1 Tax=Tenacibaculum aestuarii TaxID=362781 RepID=UPI003894222B
MNGKKEDELDKLKRLLPYARGLQREITEAEALLLTNELSRRSIKKLKYDSITNLLFLIIGGAITFFFTSISESNSRELIEGVDELKKEILENKSNYEKRIEKHKKDIFIIQRELDSLKKKSA